MDTPLLEMRGVSKCFPGVRALDGVDFTLRAGEVHALLGENGAGKSTLIKVLTGVLLRDGGDVRLEGRAIEPRSPLEAQALGVATVYQEINLIPHLSVAENICLGRQPCRRGRIDWKGIGLRARAALERLGVAVDVNRALNECSVAVQQLVAIARAIDQGAGIGGGQGEGRSTRVLVLDEPTSSLDGAEVSQLFGVLRRLKQDGLGIIFITHFLDQVYAVSDRITVLRNGKLVGSYDAAGLNRLELIAAMLGQDVAQAADLTTRRRTALPQAAGKALVRAKGLLQRRGVGPVDVELHAGEVLGLAGLLGSGRTEVARLLFGIDRPDAGEVEVEGRRMRPGSPRRAIASGLGFCPEDRKADGIIAELSVRENIVLALQSAKGWRRAMGRAAQRQIARHYIRALKVAAPSEDFPVGQLSGGNQQKVVLARWLAVQPKILLLDEPTRGIDVGAKAEIEALVQQLCAAGLGILFISSELEEVVRNCQRVAVLRDGRQVGELRGEDVSLKSIMQRIASATPS